MEWQLPKLPFFEPSHYALAENLIAWRTKAAPGLSHSGSANLNGACRAIARALAEWKFLDYVVPAVSASGEPALDVRAICIIREALAFDSALADSVFVMQGIGTAPLWRHADAALRKSHIDPCRSGEHIAAFALTEPEAGSDVAATKTTAREEADCFVLDGVKTWISNAGIADQYVVVARTGEAPGANGLSVFLVDANTPGLDTGPQIENLSDHPLGMVRLNDCRVPKSRLIGARGNGFRAAMATFDVFRTSVGAAAVGMARRALAESRERVRNRHLFGKPMSEIEAVQARIADMVVDTESAALATYRAAWAADVIGGRVTREVSIAKLTATEAAGRVVDSAVQLFGALGVAHGTVIEQLYRDVRPLRIYEGASEVQKIIIARSLLRQAK